MHDALKGNGCLVLILACALLWANFAWALPWNRITEELESTVAEELPIIEYAPLTYAGNTYNEVIYEIFDVAAAEDTWTCTNCNHENPADAKYCSACGTKKGEEAAATGLSDVSVCPKCGYVNEKEAEFCGGCGYDFYGAGPGAAGLEMVHVPGRGYLPKGTMIAPGHARTSIWVTGLLIWLLIGPGIAALGLSEKSKPKYIAGGTISGGGLIVFLIGLAVKTEPVYASRTTPGDDVQPRLAYARKSLEPDGLAVKVELPLFSF